MKKNKLRFTGEWPPIRLWDEYPNWEFALGEEDDEFQDETTLKPDENQFFIGKYTAYTAGKVVQANGKTLPALIEIIHPNIAGVYGFINEQDCWMVREIGTPPKWTCIVYEWLNESDRGPTVSFDDKDVFPIIVKLKLPWKLGGIPDKFIINSNGEKEIISIDQSSK